MVIVTDIKWRDKSGTILSGFQMDGYLMENLSPIKKFIQTDRDCVGIISGRGMVRNGKSTLAAQIGYYVAWLIAGGEMDLRRDSNGRFINPQVIKKPTKEVKFSLKNLAFSPEELIKLGTTLPKNSVIIYDEGRSGLDSKGTMKAVNQSLEDFFQECGVNNHVILVVLPNFFKLNEDIATSRSMFLVDCYSDDNWNRGFFDFFNATQKEWLFFKGKKKIGVRNKYSSASSSFHGKFSSFTPFDKQEYEALKKKALKIKALGSREARIKEKFVGMLTIYREDTMKTAEETAQRLSTVLFKTVSPFVIEHGHKDYAKFAEKHEKRGYV